MTEMAKSHSRISAQQLHPITMTFYQQNIKYFIFTTQVQATLAMILWECVKNINFTVRLTVGGEGVHLPGLTISIAPLNILNDLNDFK